MRFKVLIFFYIFPISVFALPDGFVYLRDTSPSIIIDMRYFSANNFVGRPIKGYYANRCILTSQAASALAKVQVKLQAKGYKLVVYDCYRPKQAVKDFYLWSQNKDKRMKNFYYPREKKSDLFKRGYIAKYSGHSRGSTVDLGLYSKKVIRQGSQLSCDTPNRTLYNSLDMGTNYDCLDVKSSVNNQNISLSAQKNRKILSSAMKREGFKAYSKEWWHFQLNEEPYKNKYFNFPVK